MTFIVNELLLHQSASKPNNTGKWWLANKSQRNLDTANNYNVNWLNYSTILNQILHVLPIGKTFDYSAEYAGNFLNTYSKICTGTENNFGGSHFGITECRKYSGNISYITCMGLQTSISGQGGYDNRKCIIWHTENENTEGIQENDQSGFTYFRTVYF